MTVKCIECDSFMTYKICSQSIALNAAFYLNTRGVDSGHSAQPGQ